MTAAEQSRALTREEAADRAVELAPRLAARADEHDRSATFATADLEDLRAVGLLGLMAPTRLGGAGATFADYVEVAMALAAASGSTALVFNMHASVTGALALTPDDVARSLGVPDSHFLMRDRVLASAVQGSLFVVAMSERAAGSRLSEMSTRYRRIDGGWQLTGSKAFCSGSTHADFFIVAARAQDDVGSPQVSQFLVPAGAEGLAVEQTWDPLGMRATASNDVHLCDVVVPDDALLGGIEGLGVVLAQVMPQWLVASYAAVYVGIAQAALDAGAQYIAQRGLTALPAVRARMGRADTAVAAAREVARAAAKRVDDAPGDPETNRWVWRSKLLAGETAMAVAASVLEACGTGATRRGNALERLYRDARCGSLQPATSDVCADWLGAAALGLDPEQGPIARW